MASANTDTPNGFKPVRGVGGSATFRTNEYPVTGGTPIGKHEVVLLVGGLCTGWATAGDDGQILGVAANFVSSTGSNRTCQVYDDPNQVFEAQEDGNTIDSKIKGLGGLFKITDGAPSAVTGISQQEIDSEASGATEGVLTCLQIVGFGLGITNSVSDSWTRWQVKIVPGQHVFARDETIKASA